MRRGEERLRRIDRPAAVALPLLSPLLSPPKTVVDVRLLPLDQVVPVRRGRRGPTPGVGCQAVARSLLVRPHDVQPGEAPAAGPADELLLHATLVP